MQSIIAKTLQIPQTKLTENNISKQDVERMFSKVHYGFLNMDQVAIP